MVIIKSYPKPGKIEPEYKYGLPWSKAAPSLPAVSLPSPKRPNATDITRATQIGITPDEFVRRDNIVRNLWIESPWKAGDAAVPQKKADEDTYGLCTVKQVYRSYFDFDLPEARDWPKNDNPYILAVTPAKYVKPEDRLFLCTSNWLEAKYKKDATPCC